MLFSQAALINRTCLSLNLRRNHLRISSSVVYPWIGAQSFIYRYSIVATRFYVYQEEHVSHCLSYPYRVGRSHKVVTARIELPECLNLEEEEIMSRNWMMFFCFVFFKNRQLSCALFLIKKTLVRQANLVLKMMQWLKSRFCFAQWAENIATMSYQQRRVVMTWRLCWINASFTS